MKYENIIHVCIPREDRESIEYLWEKWAGKEFESHEELTDTFYKEYEEKRGMRLLYLDLNDFAWKLCTYEFNPEDYWIVPVHVKQ